MPLIRRSRIPLALENMPQVPPTVTAGNLRPLHAKRAIRMPGDSPRDGIKVSRPAAPGLELLVRRVEGCMAACAGVDALGWVVGVVFACSGPLGAFFAKDAELFCCFR